MAEITLNNPNWLGSEVGIVRKTVTVTENSGSYVTENNRKVLKSGTLINDTDLGYGLLWNDADITAIQRLHTVKRLSPLLTRQVF